MRFAFLCLWILSWLNADASFLTLSDAYQRALAHAFKLKSAAYQADAKQEEIQEAQSQLYPQVYMSLDKVHRKYRDNLFHYTTKEAYNSASIVASQSLYRPEILSQIDSAKLQAESAKLYVTQQEQVVASRLIDAYLSVLKSQSSVRVAQSYVETNRLRYEQIRRKLELQLATKMDLAESKVVYEQSQIVLHKEERSLKLAELTLAKLVGSINVDVPKIVLEQLPVETLLPQFSHDALDRNLDLQMGKLATSIYEKEVEIAKYGHYPSVELSFSHSRYDTNDITVDYERDSRVMLEVKVPLFQGGKVNAQIEKNRLRLLASQEDFNDKQREIQLRYEGLLVTYASLVENVRLQKEAKASAQLYLYAVEKGYDRGLKSLIDLEDAKSKWYESHFKLIDTIFSLLNTYVDLLSVSGRLNAQTVERLNSFMATSR
jgi:outer membrane protein